MFYPCTGSADGMNGSFCLELQPPSSGLSSVVRAKGKKVRPHRFGSCSLIWTKSFPTRCPDRAFGDHDACVHILRLLLGRPLFTKSSTELHDLVLAREHEPTGSAQPSEECKEPMDRSTRFLLFTSGCKKYRSMVFPADPESHPIGHGSLRGFKQYDIDRQHTPLCHDQKAMDWLSSLLATSSKTTQGSNQTC